MTITERLLDTEDTAETQQLLRKLASDDDAFFERGNEFVEQRRRNHAETIAAGSLDEEEAYEMLKAREDQFVDEYLDTSLPEFLLRAEAQDIVIEDVHRKLQDAGLIEA